MSKAATKSSDSSLFSEALGVLAAHPLKGYVLHELETSLEQVKLLESKGIDLSSEDVARISSYFFKSATSSYVGIESSLPSTYYKLYPSFLKDNEEYLNRLSSRERKLTKRVLIARSGGDLRIDALLHPQEYRDFIEWHERNGIGLYWIESDKVEKIMKEYKLSTTDVALWRGLHGVTFKPLVGTDQIHIKLVRNNTNLFTVLTEYCSTVVDNSSKLTIPINRLPVMSKDLVERWEGYAGDRRFRENGIGRLIASELSGKNDWPIGRVLDASAGSGYEARYLSYKGYDVTANELDPDWNDLLNQRLLETELPVETYQYDWSSLSQHLKPLYTAVISVGNSLSMAIGKSQRETAIQEFYKLLKPGGKLIIDERNFPLIQRRLKGGLVCSSKCALYECKSVSGEITNEDLENQLIRFTLKDKATGKVLGAIVVQALANGELQEMLKKAGFRNIKTYSDLKPGYKAKAAIYTYVATK